MCNKIFSYLMLLNKVAGISGQQTVNFIMNNYFLKINIFNNYLKDVLVKINSNGKALCTPPALITTQCKLSISDFPYDSKHCTMIWGRYYIL